MKNLYKLFFISIIAISCEDSLDVIQPGELLEDQVFNTVADLQEGLNVVYFGLNTEQAIEISSLFTDETALGFDNGGQNVQLLQFQLNSTSLIPFRLWRNNYRTISEINRLLLASKNITITEEDRFRLDEIVGQLLAIRAAEYFELLTFFSTDLQDENALGVMKLDFVPNTETELPRVTNQEIFEFIESDLSQAKRLIDDTQNDPLIVSTNFITALEARMYLYRGKNTIALNKAEELISQIDLTSRSGYQNLFNDFDTNETIFIGVRNQVDRPANGRDNLRNENDERNDGSGRIAENFYFRQVRNTGGPFMEISRGLFNKLDINDIRYDVIVFRESQPDINYRLNNGTDDILLIGKYPGSNITPLQNDYKYFRVAEMHLIKAEAEAQLGNLTETAKTLQVLRDARFAQPTPLDNYSNKKEALITVLEERRIELAFEGHRYIDLKRLNPAGIDRDLVDCSSFNACQLNPTEFFKYTFPIPQSELSGNTLIREQQNPGY